MADDGDVAEMAAMAREIEGLRAALKPFADVGRQLQALNDSTIPDSAPLRNVVIRPALTVGEFKKAARAYYASRGQAG
jgi:hypothetical protein